MREDRSEMRGPTYGDQTKVGGALGGSGQVHDAV